MFLKTLKRAQCLSTRNFLLNQVQYYGKCKSYKNKSQSNNVLNENKFDVKHAEEIRLQILCGKIIIKKTGKQLIMRKKGRRKVD